MSKNIIFRIGVILSSLLCIFFICTLDYSALPSGDEIGTADSAINFLTKGEWYSAVWVYTYHPLHNFLLTGWLWLFGISHISVCSINVVIAFITSALSLKILIERRIIHKWWSAVLFVVLFWAIAPHSNGRIDCLIMLFSIGLADQIIPSPERTFKTYWPLAFYSFMLMLSGIYSFPVLLTLGLCLLIYHRKDKEKRKMLLKQAKVIVISCLVAFAIVCLFYLCNHRLLRFLQTYIRFNSNFNKGMDNLLVHYTFTQMVIWGYRNLFVISFTVFSTAYGFIKKNWNLCLLSLFILLVPVIASASGHYMPYYFWMMEVSSLFVFVWTISLMRNNIVSSAFGALALWLLLSPIVKHFTAPTHKDEIKSVEAFLKQNENLLQDSLYVHFEAQEAAKFYYGLRDYPVRISGKVRLLENYTDPKKVYQKTIYTKFGNENIRTFAMKVFDMVESYKEPCLDKGIIILREEEKYDKLIQKLDSKHIGHSRLSEYKGFVMVRFGE